MKSLAEWSNGAKINTSVVTAGVAAAPITLGAVYVIEKLFPNNAFKTWFAEKVVEPNPKIFDALSSGIRRANERHDQKVREELAKRGEPVLDKKDRWVDSKKKAYIISDSLVTAANALLIDFGASVALQSLFNHVLKVENTSFKMAFKTAGVETLIHIGCIAAMPTLFAGLSENIHHELSKMIRRTTGLDKNGSEDISLPFTYVTLPGLVATGAALIFANKWHGR